LERFASALLSRGQGDAVSAAPGSRCGRRPGLGPASPPGWVPVIARRISVAAASLISSDACSLYQAVCGVQIKLGASFSGP